MALQPELGHPQFLSSDRHITQGAVGLKDQRWADGALSLDVETVGGFPQTLRVAVPEGYALQSAHAPEATITTTTEQAGRILAATLHSEQSATVKLTLSFACP